MTESDLEFLESNQQVYDVLESAGIIKHLDTGTRERMLAIVRSEFAPNYLASLWCSSCVVDLVKFLYRQYAKWKVEHADDAVLIKRETFN